MPTTTGTSTWLARGVLQTTWDFQFGTATLGTSLDAPMLPDKAVTVRGLNFGCGATWQIEGSDIGGTGAGAFFILSHPHTASGSLTGSTGDCLQILENPRFIRPRFTSLTCGASGEQIRIVITSQSTKR